MLKEDDYFSAQENESSDTPKLVDDSPTPELVDDSPTPELDSGSPTPSLYDLDVNPTFMLEYN